MRVLNIKETGKLEGDLYPVELISNVFFCLQVDGPITEGGRGGLVSGWVYKWQLTIFKIRGSEALLEPCLILGL